MSSYSYQHKGSGREITWENYTSTATPLSAGNLNKVQASLLAIDEAVFDAVNGKADQADFLYAITDVSFDPSTGELVFTRANGQTVTFNTVLEKVATNWTYDSTTQRLILTLADGTTQAVDLSALIQQNEFVDSGTIAFTVGQDGTVRATVKGGSITADKLQPDYLTDVTAQASAAAGSAASAADYAELAESYTHGGTNRQDRPTENVDNALNYKNLAQQAVIDARAAAGLTDYSGASASAAGVHGLVPAPAAGDQDKLLKGNGTWANAVNSFNGRTGAVTPQADDYTATQVAADDTEGLMGTAGASAQMQDLIDEIADRVLSRLAASLALDTGLKLKAADNSVLSTLTAADIKTDLGLTVENDLLASAAGSVLDARQGRALGEQMATIEESATAAHAYAKGDYLVYNGILYKVTAAIAVEDTITPGTNVSSTTAGSELSELTTKNVYSTSEKVVGLWIDGKPLYRRVFQVSAPSEINVFTVVATFPAEYVVKRMEGILNDDSVGSQCFSVNKPAGNSGDTNFLSAWTSNEGSQKVIKMSVGSRYRLNKPCYIILEYTKTTD